MTRIRLVGSHPETVDYSDPALSLGMNAEKIRAGIAPMVSPLGWVGPLPGSAALGGVVSWVSSYSAINKRRPAANG
jgi:hypothetical protein